MRIGIGYDVHRLVEDRPLILGGVNVPFEKGLLGHSDADVLTHAIIDALYGAAALGDIGSHFPDSDKRYENADSIELLKACVKDIKEAGYRVVNIDTIIVAQKPKLSPYSECIRESLADALEIAVSSISVKAKTEEGLGFTGNSSGMAAHAVALIE